MPYRVHLTGGPLDGHTLRVRSLPGYSVHFPLRREQVMGLIVAEVARQVVEEIHATYVYDGHARSCTDFWFTFQPQEQSP